MAHVCIGPSRPCVLTVLEYIGSIHGFTTLFAPITFAGPFRCGPKRVPVRRAGTANACPRLCPGSRPSPGERPSVVANVVAKPD